MEIPDTISEHINLPINVEDCWTWTGTLLRDKYPMVSVGGDYVYVRRYLYEVFKKEDIRGVQITTSCKNNHCVSPYHIVTRKKRNNED